MSSPTLSIDQRARATSTGTLIPTRADGWLLGPALPATASELIPLEAIDRQDRRFQLRLQVTCDDLIESLGKHGQQCPVTLWGKTQPFKIIDGFRRIEALSLLGKLSALSVVRTDLDQTQAFAVSFIENVRRKNLTPVDRAAAVWTAVHTWQLGKPVIANAFGLSVRQIERYLQMFEFDHSLRDGMYSKKITMAHAVLLHRARVTNAAHWINEVARRKLSEKELRKRLLDRSTRRLRGSYLVRDNLGFRMRGFRFRFDMSQDDKARLRDALETAIELLQVEKNSPKCETG